MGIMKYLIVTILAFMITAQWEVAAECCNKVSVDRENGGDTSALEKHPTTFGNYKQRSGSVDGRPTWQHQQDDRLIWYNAKAKKWFIGKQERFGTAGGNARTVDIDKCVEDTGLNWEYASGDTWEFANDGLAGYCED